MARPDLRQSDDRTTGPSCLWSPQSAVEAPGPGGVFSGADARGEEGRAWKRFQRAIDWSPCALGNLPDSSDPNGVPPALFAAGRAAAAVPGPFRAGPEGVVQASARQGGGTTPGGEDEGAREPKKVESSSSEEARGGRGGEGQGPCPAGYSLREAPGEGVKRERRRERGAQGGREGEREGERGSERLTGILRCL